MLEISCGAELIDGPTPFPFLLVIYYSLKQFLAQLFLTLKVFFF